MSEKNDQGIGFNRRDFLRGGSIAAMMAMLGGIELVADAAEAPASDIKFTGVPIKVGIIGLGGWGRELLNTLLTIDHGEVAAICDNYPAFLKRAGNLAPKAKQLSDYKAIIDDPEIRAIFVATATHQHKDIVLAALKAGKHVYCEAPLANTIEDARTIALAAKALGKGQIFQAGLQLRCEPHRHFLINRVRGGCMGDPVMVRAQWHKKLSWRTSSPNPEREKALNWRLDKNLSTGLAGEIGLHHFDQIAWFLNALPMAVTGYSGLRLWNDGREVPDTIQTVFEFPGNVIFSFDATLASSFDANYELFHGTESTVMVRDNKAWMFQEVDAHLQGWEVYAMKEKFYKSTGIVLMAGASKSVKAAATAVEETPENSTLKSALQTFAKNVYDTDLKVKEVKDAGGDADLLAEQLSTVKRRPAPGYLEGFKATVLGILANEAAIGHKRIELKPQMYELA